jgi:hypothetical protein
MGLVTIQQARTARPSKRVTRDSIAHDLVVAEMIARVIDDNLLQLCRGA